ncbi:tetraacyldisaccharide 4'-kinase [Gallaecimonas sp. GXIMD4217]|uniref:tetraacyldisaccharide 4'-kinase n=1 Tax=Gallaecimonas sp. GXIMD4217 TaxID=3131927 RepID=UPI00311B1697
MVDRLQRAWQQGGWLSWLLLPLAGLFWAISALRRLGYRAGWLRRYRAPVPVLVVGNITVGGNGKTPAVMAIAQALQARGFKPGLIARGYGAEPGDFPRLVTRDADPGQVGDEPAMIGRRTGLPMAVGPDRRKAIETLLANHDIDLVISDDGLQHYALERDLELVVMDGERRLGNGRLLPAGPLREGAWRLATVDAVLVNGGEARAGEWAMTLAVSEPRRLVDEAPRPWSSLAGPVTAAAAIGHPPRFFRTLARQGLAVQKAFSFADHHGFSAEDFAGIEGPLLMTEKDAVKCRPFAREDWYYVPVDAQIPDAFFDFIERRIRKRCHGL